jgi:uncharacterized membrane protein (UPF0127 family)
MKDMRFPIDIIWFKDHKVVYIESNVPAVLNAGSNADYPVYKPNSDSNGVLEVKAGWARQFNLKMGDEIQLNPIN